MNTQITLTTKQRQLLRVASLEFSGNTVAAAYHLNLRANVFENMTLALTNAGLLEFHRLTEAAYVLLGHWDPLPTAFETFGWDGTAKETPPTAEIADAPDTAIEAFGWDAPQPKQRKTRAGTKQAQVIEMLKRPEGATLTQIMEMTGWLMHTARAVLSRTIQKDLGIALASEKTSGSERVYRVA